MTFFLGFLFLFIIVGMSTRSFGWFSYLAIIASVVVLAGAYTFSGSVWG